MSKKNTQISYDTPLPFWFANSVPVKLLSHLYLSAVNCRNNKFTNNPNLVNQLSAPVISVGGIRAGGTGKTPTALLIGYLLTQQKYEIAFLSRGYRKPHKGYFIARPGQNISWRDTGDEPAMLHKSLPESWLGIGADRLKNAQLIGSKIGKRAAFILDDGFQHRKIKRDLDIVCLNESAFDDLLIPRGYLREPIDSLSRAHVIFLIGTENDYPKLLSVQEKIAQRFPHLDIYILEQEFAGWVDLKTGALQKTLKKADPVALCGIARPERFFKTLEAMNIYPSKQVTFSDHHCFTLNDFQCFHKLYSKGIVLTEKDAIRVNDMKSQIESDILYLRIRLKFHSEDLLKRFNKKLLSIFDR